MARHERTAYALAMSRARRSTLLRLAQLAGAGAVSAACTGYAVVDPLPAPAYCGGDAGATHHFGATSVWVNDGDGSVDLVLVVTIHKLDPAFTGTITVNTTAELVAQGPDINGGMVIKLRPSVGAKSVTIPLNISCIGAQGTLTVSWTADPVAGRKETVVLSP